MIYSLVGESPRQTTWPAVQMVLPFSDGACRFLLGLAVVWMVVVGMASAVRPRFIGALRRAGPLAMAAQWLLNWCIWGGNQPPRWL